MPRTVVVAADSSKFGRVAFASVLSESPPDLFACEIAPPRAYLQFFGALGMRPVG